MSAGSAICRVDRINAGTQRLITLDLLGNAVGSFAASISVDAIGDGDISNNTAAFDFNVAPAVDLAVDAGNSLIIRAGDPVQLQWLASNEEIVDASNVDVFVDWSGGTLVFDERSNLLSWTRKPGTEGGGGTRWEQEISTGRARREALLESLATRIKAGQLDISGSKAPSWKVRREAGVLRFEFSLHFARSGADEGHEGGSSASA